MLADVEVLKDACRLNIGDITFQEAYDRTRRILNITINPPDAVSLGYVCYMSARI